MGGDVGRLEKVLRVGDVVIDVKNFLVWVRGKPVALRLREFELLAALAWRPRELMTREELAAAVWGRAGARSSRTIDVHVQRLRAALAQESSFDYVETVRGFGYRFVVPGAAPGPASAREAPGGRAPGPHV